MLEWLASMRPYLEAAYFCAGISIIFGLLLANQQLNLLRVDIKLRNERAAKEKAICACERYLDAFVRKANEAFKQRDAKKLPDYHGPIGDFSRDSVPVQLWDSGGKKLLLETALPALNELEATPRTFFRVALRTRPKPLRWRERR